MTNPCKACLNDVSTVCCNCVWYLFHTAYITNIKMKSIISCLLFLCLFLVMRKYGSYPTCVYTSYASRPYYAPSKKSHWVPPRRTKGYEPTHHKKPFYPKPSKKDTLGTEWRAILVYFDEFVQIAILFLLSILEVVETFYSTSETVAFVLNWTLNYRVFLIASVGFDSNEGGIIYLLSKLFVKFLHNNFGPWPTHVNLVLMTCIRSLSRQ